MVQTLLRPDQIEAYKSERSRLENLMTQPNVDKGEANKQLRKVKGILDTQSPQPFDPASRDKAAKRVGALKAEMLEDAMPDQEEMRRNPPGAVAKHIRWEDRNKKKLQEWKYLTRRLEPDNDDADLTNFERFRPKGNFGERLAMDGAQIPQSKQYFFPQTNEPTAVMGEKESNALRELDPELHSRMFALDNSQRAEVLAMVRRIQGEPEVDLIAKQEKPKEPAKAEKAMQRLMAKKEG
jgi:hypothetical protein